MPPGLRFARLLPCGIALAAGAGCTEAVVPTRSGAADLPLESTVVIGVPSDRAITYRVVAPASSGLYVTATAQNAEARIFAGHAGETSTAMSIGVEPTVGFGPLRSATFPVGPTGEVQIAVMAAVPGGPAPTVQLLVHLDTSFDAAVGRGRLLAGVDYGAGRAECGRFGYLVTSTDTLATLSARSGNLADVTFGATRAAPPSSLGSRTSWLPMPGASATDLEMGSSDAFGLGPGQWTLSVCGTPVPARFRLALYSTRPERVGAAVLLGDTTSGESIDAPGDVDDFTVSGSPGDSLFVALAGGDPTIAASLQVQLPVGVNPQNQPAAHTANASQPLLATVTPVAYLGGSGTITFRVAGLATVAQHKSRGPYRVAALRAPATAPESRSAALVIGDSVLAETLWAPVDVDRYVLTTPPGTPFTVEFRKVDDLGGATQVACVIENGRGTVGQAILSTDPTGLKRMPVNFPQSVFVITVNSPDRSVLGRYQLRILPGLVP